MGVFKYCKKCKDEKREPWYRLYPDTGKDIICEIHSEIMQTMPLTTDEFFLITDISQDVSFLEAMIKLKQDDIIEYQSRMSQFKNQIQQQEQSKKQEDNTPKCPTCGSANIEKISLSSKVVGGALFGLFSSNVRKTMHCKNCGYKW
ncbi:MAG: hypothetical protein Q8873_01795 [Bacillota bacterium]|nr:hypothetical protein [Bacillota bacterium]